MPKRRRLVPQQEVIIIYDANTGFVQETAVFKSYRRIMYEGVSHEIPVFEWNEKEITGLQCFWVLRSDIGSVDRIQKMQYELIASQVMALEVALLNDYKVPFKVKDAEIEKIATENASRLDHLIKKIGFDPRDESWIEAELATTSSEKNWFQFDRENALVFTGCNWPELVEQFNSQYKEGISEDDAKLWSRKRMRYYMGAYHVRMTGNSDTNAWKKAAREFERTYRLIEERMRNWSQNRGGRYPLVRSKKPISFFMGPYFRQCSEKIPYVFTDAEFTHIKKEIVLRVVSYDPKTKNIRLDFTTDIRKMIKPEDADSKPWVKDMADYDMWIMPEEIESHLEILESLE